MGFLSTSTNNMGNLATSVWGEAPQLSATYAQYDNGAQVFLIYDNGTALFPTTQTGNGGSGPSTTASAPSPYVHAITGSVSSGASSSSTWTIDGETSTTLPSSYIAQMLVQLTGSAPLTDLLTNFAGVSGQFYAFRLDARSGLKDIIGYYPSGATQVTVISSSSTTSSTGTWYQMTVIDAANSLSMYKSTTFDLSTYGTEEVSSVTGQGYTGGGIAVTTDGATSTDYWTMILVRAYPPSGVMPSMVFGSIIPVSAPGNFIITISNTVLITTSMISYLNGIPMYLLNYIINPIPQYPITETLLIGVFILFALVAVTMYSRR